MLVDPRAGVMFCLVSCVKQYVGEISYGLTFSSILGSILAPFWKLWAAIWHHLGCPGGYWKVCDIWGDLRRYLGRPGNLVHGKMEGDDQAWRATKLLSNNSRSAYL